MQQAKAEEGAFRCFLEASHQCCASYNPRHLCCLLSAGTNFAIDRVVRMTRDPSSLQLHARVNVTPPVQVALQQGRSIGRPMVSPQQWNAWRKSTEAE